MTDEVTLTKREVTDFLARIGLETCKAQDSDGQRKLDYLRRLLKQFQQFIPFTNLCLLSTEKKHRGVMSWNKIKGDIMDLRGGLCQEINTFMYALVSHLGFDAWQVIACVSSSGGMPVPGQDRDDHTMTIVKNVSQAGDLYLLDVGFGCPMYEPFSLDFDTESPVYKHSYVTSKYTKDGERFVRKRLKDKKDNEADAKWIVDYTFTLGPCMYKDIVSQLNNVVYCYKEGRLFHTDIRAAIELPERERSRAFKVTKDAIIIYEGSSGDKQLSVSELSSLTEFQQFVTTYFPNMHWDTLKRVIAETRQV